MVKIRVSYENPEELRRIMEKLQPDVSKWKIKREQRGRFFRAYTEIKE